MPREYASARPKPRARDTGPLAPTMIDDRIGTIGSTQGVNESSRPATRKTPATVSRLPERSADSTRPLAGSALAGAAGVAVDVDVVAAVANAVVAGAAAEGKPSGIQVTCVSAPFFT